MKRFILLCLILLLFGCEKERDLDSIIAEDNYIIVDVRTMEEYNERHLVDALNIPYDEISEDTVLDKNKTILVYCKSGTRSGIAYKILKDLGYNVYDLGALSEIDLPME